MGLYDLFLKLVNGLCIGLCIKITLYMGV